MGNAQEAIEEYEEQMHNARRVDITKIVPQTYKNVTMILDHEYSENGDVRYLTQWQDGLQKWVKTLENYCFEWTKLLKEYWANQADAQDKTPDNEP